MSHDDLQERVLQFTLMKLPGQPRMMHMGTAYLVNDLAARVRELETALAESRKWHEGAREVARLLTGRAERAEAERDALRALLVEASQRVDTIDYCSGEEGEWQFWERIDAALSGSKP